jgi:hypothetical protein
MSSLYGVVHYIRIFTRYWMGNVRLTRHAYLYAGIHAFPHDILEKCICRDPNFLSDEVNHKTNPQTCSNSSSYLHV